MPRLKFKPMTKPLSVYLQYLLPQQALTECAGRFARWQGGWWTRAVIRWFVKRYQVNMEEAQDADITHYASFNAFFTRALKLEARPLAHADWVCPVDGAISQFGRIAIDQIFQAKGHHYSTRALLGGDAQLAAQFRNGDFATIYLSPKDYHRIHMPAAGRLLRMVHVPGDLFSVNPATAQGVPGLFARNERVVCVFDSFTMVLVGATIVGSMATTWHGVVNPPRSPTVREWHYEDSVIALQQGDEMGRFLLGSTVVVLWSANTLRFNPDWAPALAVRMGEKMSEGRISNPKLSVDF